MYMIGQQNRILAIAVFFVGIAAALILPTGILAAVVSTILLTPAITVVRVLACICSTDHCRII